jgi:hypothetical protein
MAKAIETSIRPVTPANRIVVSDLAVLFGFDQTSRSNGMVNERLP